MMTIEQAYTKIEQTYKSEKGKNFVLHLVRSFLPINKSSFVEDLKSGKCSITGQSLVGQNQVAELYLKNASEQFKHVTKTLIAALEEKAPEETESPVKKALGNRVLGVKCEKSDKLLCVTALQALQKFAIEQMLAGDRTMQYSVNQQRREENPNPHPKKQENSYKQEVKRATTKLGDISNLQALKEKLEQQENSSKS